MIIKRVYFLPLIAPFCVMVAFIISYFMSITQQHVPVFIPYVSDTGTFSPESCLFTMALMIFSNIIIIFSWVRLMHIRNYCIEYKNYKLVRHLNTYGFSSGLFAAFGAIGVGSFQVTNLLKTHLVFAGVLFTALTCYVAIQTYISQIVPIYANYRLRRIRFILSVLIVIAYFNLTLAVFAYAHYDGEDYTKWRPGEAGYILHVLSAVAEWTYVFTLCLCLMTFTPEFHKVAIKFPELQFSIEGASKFTRLEEKAN